MSIVRAARPTGNFYILDKAISEDKRLSWGARGLLVFLLGKPDHWTISIEHLRAETADSDLPSGRDSVYRIINALIDAGYIKRVQKVSDGGRKDGVEYHVSEIPGDAPPLPALPDPDHPDPAKPTLVSIDVKQGSKKLSKIHLDIPDWIPKESWEGFVDMRIKIRKPMTDRAVSLMVAKLDRFRSAGLDVASLLDASTINCWQDVYEAKAKQVKPHYIDKQDKNRAFMDVLTGRSDSYDADDPFTIDAPAKRIG